jgi:hypothetical protein
MTLPFENLPATDANPLCAGLDSRELATPEAAVSPPCPFCSLPAERFVLQSEFSVVIRDGLACLARPVNRGCRR